jgi:hypothetical protein
MSGGSSNNRIEQSRDVKVEVMVGLMSRYDIIHDPDIQWELWPPVSRVFSNGNTHRYVTIIEGLNHSLERVWRENIDKIVGANGREASNSEGRKMILTY